MQNEAPEIRTENLMVKMTPSEKAMLIEAAKDVGLTISDFIRLLIRQWANGITFEKKKAALTETTDGENITNV